MEIRRTLPTQSGLLILQSTISALSVIYFLAFSFVLIDSRPSVKGVKAFYIFYIVL